MSHCSEATMAKNMPADPGDVTVVAAVSNNKLLRANEARGRSRQRCSMLDESQVVEKFTFFFLGTL